MDIWVIELWLRLEVVGNVVKILGVLIGIYYEYSFIKNVKRK